MTEHDEHDLDGTEVFADFDAFFEEEGPQPEDERTGMPLVLYGRTYRLPGSMPGVVGLQIHRLGDSQRPEDIRSVLGALLGPDAVAHFAEQGMSDRKFSIVLGWAIANTARPGSLSLAEAAARYDEEEAAKAGKARTAPRARPKSKAAAKTRKKKASSSQRS